MERKFLIIGEAIAHKFAKKRGLRNKETQTIR